MSTRKKKYPRKLISLRYKHRFAVKDKKVCKIWNVIIMKVSRGQLVVYIFLWENLSRTQVDTL